MAGSTKAPISKTRLTNARADFSKEDFDDLILQKGLKMTHEKTMYCPCRGKTSGRPNVECQDCFGSGLLFKDSVNIRGVIQSIGKNPTYRPMGEDDEGTARLTVVYDDRIGWMDRITLQDGEDVFYENVYPIIRDITGPDTECSALLVYPPIKVSDVHLYVDKDTASTELVQGTDYTFTGRKIVLSTALRNALAADLTKDEYQIAIRYTHLPQYLIRYIDHNVRNTRTIDSGAVDNVKKLPLSCLIRKSHYFMNDKGFYEFPENQV